MTHMIHEMFLNLIHIFQQGQNQVSSKANPIHKVYKNL
jgi:hypothetical protein